MNNNSIKFPLQFNIVRNNNIRQYELNSQNDLLFTLQSDLFSLCVIKSSSLHAILCPGLSLLSPSHVGHQSTAHEEHSMRSKAFPLNQVGNNEDNRIIVC